MAIHLECCSSTQFCQIDPINLVESRQKHSKYKLKRTEGHFVQITNTNIQSISEKPPKMGGLFM